MTYGISRCVLLAVSFRPRATHDFHPIDFDNQRTGVMR
jgi:hypothetical protein